jgi:hypothetical protein
MLPNFLIIGAPRSATTFLSRCASDHPEIFVACLEKHGTWDVHFFDVCTEMTLERHFEKGLEWYEQLFRGATNETAIGEKTAAYLCDPQAPELIHQYLPDVRMIAILRNPVERAYSHYLRIAGQLPLGMSLLEACFSERGRKNFLLESGFYYEHIMRYLELFDRSRFLFLIYEDLRAAPLDALQRVFRFLGVNPGFVPSQHDRRINAVLSRRHASHYLRLLGGFVKGRFPRLFLMARRSQLTLLLEEKIGRDSDVDPGASRYPSMSADDRARLSDVYSGHNRRLSAFLGRDLVGLWDRQVETP